MNCRLCGHDLFTAEQHDHDAEACRWKCLAAGSVTLSDGRVIWLCHNDDHSCYRRWTGYGDRPNNLDQIKIGDLSPDMARAIALGAVPGTGWIIKQAVANQERMAAADLIEYAAAQRARISHFVPDANVTIAASTSLSEAFRRMGGALDAMGRAFRTFDDAITPEQRAFMRRYTRNYDKHRARIRVVAKRRNRHGRVGVKR